jgi:hypothetical protein
MYVKMWYGYSATVVQMQVTPGTGSNGTGTISGSGTSTPWVLSGFTTNEGATTYASYFSGDSGGFRMFLWQSVSINSGTMFGLCRSVDSSGAKTADYFSAMAASAAASANIFYQAFSVSAGNGPLLTNSYAWPIGASSLASGNYGGVTASEPVFPLVAPGAVFGNPMLDFVAIKAGDTADGATITVTQDYSGTHTYIVGKTNFFSTRTFYGGQDSPCPAMRYE